KNGIWGSTGTAMIRELQVQRGIKEMKAAAPFTLHFNNGTLDVKKFALRGDNTSLEINSIKTPNFPLSLALNGKIDLGLLSFLTPFFDDLRGSLAVTTQFSISPTDWKLLGSAFI